MDVSDCSLFLFNLFFYGVVACGGRIPSAVFFHSYFWSCVLALIELDGSFSYPFTYGLLEAANVMRELSTLLT